jgi:S1-C subfamily serine protease
MSCKSNRILSIVVTASPLVSIQTARFDDSKVTVKDDWLGVFVAERSVTERRHLDISNSAGVVILGICPESPSELTGLQPGGYCRSN